MEAYENVTKCCKSLICERIKLVLSSIVVTLLIIVLFVGIAMEYSILQLHPAANFILLFFALLLLAYVEALHYAVVAVEKWDMKQYADRFPRAVKCHSLVDTPEKVKKFLVGRQFFVIFVVFLIAEITSFPNMPANFAGMPPALVLVLVKTGLPGVALVLTFGQLISQIFVEEYTLQFLNLIGCEFCIRLSLGAEYIGICNFSWLLYHINSRVFCSHILKVQRSMKSSDNMLDNSESAKEQPMSPTVMNRGPDFDNGIPEPSLTIFDICKYIWSSAATIGSIVVICYGIANRAYTLPVEPAGAFIVVILDLTMLFFLEGLMIAIVGTQYWDPETFKDVYPRAYKLHKIINKPDNVKRFIIGRQFCTVLTGFLIAQVTTFVNMPSEGYNPVLFYIVVKSGLVGVLVVLAFGQLMPELLAAEFPLRFMNMYGSYTVGYISLFFDNLAVGHCAWSVYYITRNICCGKQDQGAHDAHAQTEMTKPKIVRVNSAEILAVTKQMETGMVNNKA